MVETVHPKLADKSLCTGCGACANGCGKGAIHMLPDREGFLYPTVTDACIVCGHCTHICPVLKQREPRAEPEAFAAWSLDDSIRENSTAGGVFTVLATLEDVSDCLPPDMFARIRWDEVLNLSLVDSIDVRILYIGKSTYFVDRMFADTVMQSFHMISQDSACLLEPASYYDSVFIRVTEKFQRVRINEIQWIESYHNYCDIYTTGTSRPYCCLISLATWQKILPQKHFMRLHRSVIVNVNHVDAIQTGKVYIQGHSFEVSRTQRRKIPKVFHLIQRRKSGKRLPKWQKS